MRPYTSPQIEALGSIRELTLAKNPGCTNPGNKCGPGSDVQAPGLTGSFIHS